MPSPNRHLAFFGCFLIVLADTSSLDYIPEAALIENFRGEGGGE